MKFTDYYKSLIDEREAFVDKISEVTLSHRSTVSRWVNGHTIPSKAKREAISEALNIPEEELFPIKTDSHD